MGIVQQHERGDGQGVQLAAVNYVFDVWGGISQRKLNSRSRWFMIFLMKLCIGVEYKMLLLLLKAFELCNTQHLHILQTNI